MLGSESRDYFHRVLPRRGFPVGWLWRFFPSRVFSPDEVLVLCQSLIFGLNERALDRGGPAITVGRASTGG